MVNCPNDISSIMWLDLFVSFTTFVFKNQCPVYLGTVSNERTFEVNERLGDTVWYHFTRTLSMIAEPTECHSVQVMATIPSKTEVIDLTGLTDSSDSNSEDGREVELDGKEGGSEDGSDASEIEITLNEETRSQVQSAISTVSESRLRQLLKILVETDITVEAALTRELVTLKRGTQKIVPRWETCGKCDEEFDTNTIREVTECEFHPGQHVHISN